MSLQKEGRKEKGEGKGREGKRGCIGRGAY